LTCHPTCTCEGGEKICFVCKAFNNKHNLTGGYCVNQNPVFDRLQWLCAFHAHYQMHAIDIMDLVYWKQEALLIYDLYIKAEQHKRATIK